VTTDGIFSPLDRARAEVLSSGSPLPLPVFCDPLAREKQASSNRIEIEIELQRELVILHTGLANIQISNAATLTTTRGGIMTAIPKSAAAALAGLVLALPVHAQAPLTYSSWLPPTHHLTLWQAAEVERATGGRVKFRGLPKAPAAAPGTFDAVRDGLVDLSYVK
jgi:hypothetical protein